MGIKINQLATETTPASTDFIVVADPTSGLAKKMTVQAFKDYLDSLGGGSGDTTPPTITSRVVANGTPGAINLTFSESVTATSAGFSARRNGSNWAISSITGSGTSWTLNMATNAATGETLDLSYNAGTGNTLDGAGNELATFTNVSVTNNVSGSGYETESAAYFASNTGLTTPQQNAINAFVISLKAIGWTKFRAVYLPVWGTSGANRWNLVNPADTDGAFRLTFAGTVTHGAGFIKSDGSTGYANTYLNGASALSANNCGLTVAVKGALTGGNSAAIGSATASLANIFGIFPAIGTSTFCYAYDSGGGSEFTSEAFGTSPGDKFITMSRRSSTLLAHSINGVTEVTNTATVSGSMPNQNIYLLGLNNNGTADRFAPAGSTGEWEYQFFAIHEALDSSANSNLLTAWTTLKTALSI